MKKSCDKISKLASDKLERELSLREVLGMKLHLMMCGACRAYNNNLEKLHKALEIRLEMPCEHFVLPKKEKEEIRQKIQKVSTKH